MASGGGASDIKYFDSGIVPLKNLAKRGIAKVAFPTLNFCLKISFLGNYGMTVFLMERFIRLILPISYISGQMLHPLYSCSDVFSCFSSEEKNELNMTDRFLSIFSLRGGLIGSGSSVSKFNDASSIMSRSSCQFE